MSPAGQGNSQGSAGMANMPGMSSPQSTQQSGAGDRKVLYWFDPMHPAYKSDKPGVAPDCGMTLLPKYADDQGAGKMPMGTVTITPEKQVLAGVRTAVVGHKPLVRDIRTTAQIVADETRIAHVHVKVAGYIDQVYVDFVGQLVKKGQPAVHALQPRSGFDAGRVSDCEAGGTPRLRMRLSRRSRRVRSRCSSPQGNA